jgi:hypothetical protein
MVKAIKLLITFLSLIYSVQILAVGSLSSEIEGYLNAHRLLKVDFNNPKNSLSLMRETKQFIDRVGADNLLGSSAGKELLSRQKKLRNAYRVKNQLSDCGESRRNLGERLTQATLATSHCELYGSLESEPVLESSQFIQNVMNRDESSLSAMKRNSYHDVIVNSAKTIWEYDRQFGEHQHGEILKYVDEFCDTIGKKNCKDPLLIRKLGEARREFERIAAIKPEVDLKKNVEEFQGGLKSLNTNLKLVEDKDAPSSQLAYSIYQIQYQQMMSSQLGGLMLTPSMIEKMGAFKTLDDIDEIERTRKQRRDGVPKRYGIPEHEENIEEKDLRDAYHELRKETLEGIEDVHEEFEDEDPHEFIKNVMRTHPASLGTTLVKNPHMASLVCELIGEIETSDRRWSGFKKVAIVGGIVLGTVAAITVVGSGVAAALYTASAAAATGTAATTLAASASTALLIGGVATGVGFAVGVGETALWAYETNHTQEEIAKIRLALLAKTTDEAGAQEVQNMMNEHEAAMQKALISGAFTVVDVLAFTKLARMAGELTQVAGGKVFGKMSGSVNSLVQLMGENKKIKDLVGRMGAFFKNSDGAFGKLVAKLGGMKEGVMRKFLNNMSELSEEEVEKILRRMFSCG